MSAPDSSIMSALDAAVPAPLAKFDAFPKLPSTYQARTESRGFLTVFVSLVAVLLILNDIGEYIWGWPDYEFSVDKQTRSFMNVNVDMVVAMPCQYLSVDLRDAVGDRMFLSKGFRRDGTKFDVGQATSLKEHAASLSAREAISQSRKSRGFFSTLWSKSQEGGYKPTYNYQADGSACRIFGSVEVKKVTANLHITTLGHGYASMEHVDHSKMNLSHVITEFSFGPYFPSIVQPLDNSFELAPGHFMAYQYFLHVVPTTYIAPRTSPLRTHQYSVTHYTRELDHGHAQGTPGIFFKFEMDPLAIEINQRTTTLAQLFIRCAGVVGGVFVCMGYAIRVGSKALEVVDGPDKSQGIVAAEATGVRAGLRSKWGGGHLRSRSTAHAGHQRQGSQWNIDLNTPNSAGGFSSPATPYSPYMNQSGYTPTGSPSNFPPSPFPQSPNLFGTPIAGSPRPPAPPYSPSVGAPTAATAGSPYAPSIPTPGSGGGLNMHIRTGSMSTPRSNYSMFPPTPNPASTSPNSGFPPSPRPGSTGFPSDGGPPRSPAGMGRSVSQGSKKDKDD